MSYIDVYAYDGDAEEFREGDEFTAGQRDKHRSFTDGEELDAASYIVDLVSRGVHFDVRHTRF